MEREADESGRAVSRRRVLRTGAAGICGVTAASALAVATDRPKAAGAAPGGAGAMAPGAGHDGPAMATTVGEVDHAANGFHPDDILNGFDHGRLSTLPDGRTLREYDVVVQNRELELVPGIKYAAWTYNGRVPGPTFRCTEGDRLRINFANASDHAHSMHFHGVHPANMDGVLEPVPPGGSFVYEFDAEPFGLHLYHCHVAPLAQHIAKGLYGAFIVDPPRGRPPVDREMVMILAGLDIDFDGKNDFYMVNSVPFHYDRNPIRIGLNEKIRVYVVNILEYDQSNSLHLHGNLFQYYPTGTSLEPRELTDTISFMQGQRAIIEFSYKFPGRYMCHAHKTEFSELGWTGFFDVRDSTTS